MARAVLHRKNLDVLDAFKKYCQSSFPTNSTIQISQAGGRAPQWRNPGKHPSNRRGFLKGAAVGAAAGATALGDSLPGS